MDRTQISRPLGVDHGLLGPTSDNDIWKRIFTNRTLVLAKEASSLEGTSCLEASRALAEERKGVGHGVERYHLSNLNST